MNDQLGKRTNDRTSGGGRAGAGIAERLEFKGVLFLEGIFNLLTLGARMDTSPHLGYNASLMIASEEKEMRNNSFVFYCRAKCKYIPVSSSRGICRAQFRAIICRNCVPFFLSFFLSFSAVPFSLYSCHSPSYIVILIIRRCRRAPAYFHTVTHNSLNRLCNVSRNLIRAATRSLPSALPAIISPPPPNRRQRDDRTT